MITHKVLEEAELDQLYSWVDELVLSKPKKNISRDFSDGVLMAEVIYHFAPRMINMHNYPPASGLKAKVQNWTVLASKVLSKLNIIVTDEDCRRLSSATNLAVEPLLFAVKRIFDEVPVQASPTKENSPEKNMVDSRTPIKNVSKVQELKEILTLLKQKIVQTQATISNYDYHIKELQELIEKAHV